MMAKPIRALELLYPIIQFLIISSETTGIKLRETVAPILPDLLLDLSDWSSFAVEFMLADFSTGLFSWVFAASTTPTFK